VREDAVNQVPLNQSNQGELLLRLKPGEQYVW